jgi:hypothetical protein
MTSRFRKTFTEFLVEQDQLKRSEIIDYSIVKSFHDQSLKADVAFVPVTQLSRDSYPSIGYIRLENNQKVSASSVFKTGNKITVEFTGDVELSNQHYQSDEAGKLKIEKMLETFFKSIAAKYKAVGVKAKILKKNKLPKTLYNLVLQISFEVPELKSRAGKFGIKVTAGDNSLSNVFTGTNNDLGPWNSREEAEWHIDDLRKQLAYDDDFKNPSFSVVEL